MGHIVYVGKMEDHGTFKLWSLKGRCHVL